MKDSTHQRDVSAWIDLSLPIEFRMALRAATGASPGRVMSAFAERVEGAPRSTWSDWREALREQLATSGMLSRKVSLDFAEACGSARPGTPLVTFTAHFGWLALLARDRNRVQVLLAKGPSRWMDQEELTRSVDSELLEGDHDWVALEAGFAGGLAGSVSGTGEVPSKKDSAFANLLEIVHPERAEILAIILYSAFTGLLTLAIPVAVQQLVNTVAFGGLAQPVIVLALLLLMGLAISACLYAFQAYLAELIQRRIFVRGCLDLAHRLPRVREGGFGHYAAPAFVNRFFDLVTVQKTGARLLLEGSGVVLQTVTGLLVLSFYHPLMLALSLFLLAAMAAVAYSFGRGASGSAIQESAAKYEIAAWLEELVRHPTTFRTSAGRQRSESRADVLVASWVDARRHHYRIVFRQFVAALGLQVSVNTGLLALGGFLVVRGELTLGQLVASEIIVASVVASFARLAKHFESYYDLLAAVDKVSDLFDLPLEAPPRGCDGEESETKRPARLTAHDLTLDGTHRKLLRDVSLDLAPGERVVIVGGSGAGKGELLDVLAGVRKPDAGYVTLNDRDLRDLSPQATRDRIRLIRAPQILPETVLSNLTVSASDATLETVQEVLASVDLLDEIRRFPKGLETRLDERGAPLDRCQVMRLEIARALIAKPAVILLDLQESDFEDASMASSLDTLFAADAPWTLLAVSTTKEIASRCDRVLEIDAGVVHETTGDPSRSSRSGDVS